MKLTEWLCGLVLNSTWPIMIDGYRPTVYAAHRKPTSPLRYRNSWTAFCQLKRSGSRSLKKSLHVVSMDFKVNHRVSQKEILSGVRPGHRSSVTTVDSSGTLLGAAIGRAQHPCPRKPAPWTQKSSPITPRVIQLCR